METVKARLTMLFEDPFWIGLYEKEEDGRYSVCKITFGAEPKDYEVYAFLLRNWRGLRFGPAVLGGLPSEGRINPKRRQRIIRDELQDKGVGTKAQQTLKLYQEQNKAARQLRSREQKEAEKEWQFNSRQKKRKAKHRGH